MLDRYPPVFRKLLQSLITDMTADILSAINLRMRCSKITFLEAGNEAKAWTTKARAYLDD